MPQIRRRPAGTGRGGIDAGNVRAGHPHHITAVITAVDRLPPPIRARYLAAYTRWAMIHAHHCAAMRLIEARS